MPDAALAVIRAALWDAEQAHVDDLGEVAEHVAQTLAANGWQLTTTEGDMA